MRIWDGKICPYSGNCKCCDGFVGYLILRIQNLLFLNPNGIEGMESSLSFNTIISFMTNTNLQHYSGESGLSYAAQMCVVIL